MGGLNKTVFPGSDQEQQILVVGGEKVSLLVQVLHALQENTGQR